MLSPVVVENVNEGYKTVRSRFIGEVDSRDVLEEDSVKMTAEAKIVCRSKRVPTELIKSVIAMRSS